MSIIDMSKAKTDLPYGTLDLLILKTLDTMGPLHGYSIARRIEQSSNNLRLSQGSIYPALMRLEQQGWISTDRKSTRLNSSHLVISYAVFCLKKKKKN